jgi:hypothetical protein
MYHNRKLFGIIKANLVYIQITITEQEIDRNLLDSILPVEIVM